MAALTPPTPVRLGSFTPSVLLAVAQRTGTLADAGLEVEEHPVTSSPGQFASLRDGDLDVGLTSPDNVIAYRFSPNNPLGELLDARIVGGVDRGMGLGLYGRPGLTEAHQLRGAVVGVDVPTSGFALALYALADHLGVTREEYELVALGSTPRRLEALLDGRCDATMLNAGNELQAEAAGCQLLGAAGDVCDPYLGTVVAVVGEQHLEVAGVLTEALEATAAALLNGDHHDVAAEAAVDRLGLSPELAQRFVDRLRSPQEGLTTGGVDVAALETLVRLRRHYLPEERDGADLLEHALDVDRGLVHRRAV